MNFANLKKVFCTIFPDCPQMYFRPFDSCHKQVHLVRLRLGLHQLGLLPVKTECVRVRACVGFHPTACVCIHVCVHGWLSSLCLAFATRARALRLPWGHHCPRSPQPSGHRCSLFDTVLLTHTPHSLDVWVAKRGTLLHVTLARHWRPGARTWLWKGEAIASTVLIPPPCIMEQKSPEVEGSFAWGGVHKRIMGKPGASG